jgi:hypothetical protein
VDNFRQYLRLQKIYILYLERHAIPFIRHGDLVEFRRYFAKIKGLRAPELPRTDKLEEFKLESKFFKIFLETTLGQIGQRADLQFEPLDEGKIQDRLQLFLGRQKEIKEEE